MTSRNELLKAIGQAMATAWRADQTYQVGQSEQYLYLQTRDQVFRLSVEEIDQIATEEQADGFMATLAHRFGP